ncbi:MAG: thiosulfate oxidation carrier protein SoxY [Hyphomicrobium sp.]|jgi:sulfur-oxidizing protein SoxY
MKGANVLDRRTFLLEGAAAAAILGLIGRAPSARAEAAAEETAEFKAALESLIGKATPQEQGLSLDLPDSVENGDYVPVALAVDSPMTAEDHVKAIHLLSTANPRASVATFRFSLQSGKARVTSRMRLAKTQDVVAVAELSGRRILLARRKVDVKVGGCGI